MNKVVLPNEVMLGEVSAFLREGKKVIIMTKGNSMLPFIRGEKDSVNLQLREGVEPGDIVLAQLRPGHYVLHRVVSVEDGIVTLHGDGNLRGNEKCRLEDICGTAIEIVRPSGKASDCVSPRTKRLPRLWNRRSFFFRRVFLGFYRRLFI